MIAGVVAMLFCTALVAACGSATSDVTGGGVDSPADTGTEGVADADIVQTVQAPVPGSVKDFFDGICSDYRPVPIKKDEDLAGQTAAYDEIVAEEDWGGEIAEGTKLYVGNINGAVFVYGTNDTDKASWGVRKWALAETGEDSKKGLGNIQISAGTKADEARVVANHPDSSYPGVRYQTCVVVNTPSSWAQSLKNVAGDVFVFDVMGTVKVSNGNGNINVGDAGGNSVEIENQSGNIVVSARPSSAVSVLNGSGNITYHLLESTHLKNDSSLDTKNGTIKLVFNAGTGAKLDALVDAGTISAPDLPAPEAVDANGQRLVADVNGGGAKLTAHSETGTITVELLKPQTDAGETE